MQLAKGLGAFVVGVCSTKNVQMVRDLGADEVVDYKTSDVTQKYQSQDFDIVFDTTGAGLEVRDSSLCTHPSTIKFCLSEEWTFLC